MESEEQTELCKHHIKQLMKWNNLLFVGKLPQGTSPFVCPQAGLETPSYFLAGYSLAQWLEFSAAHKAGCVCICVNGMR